MKTISLVLLTLFVPTAHAVRARDLGIQVGRMKTGKWNAITDVAGVRVGQKTLNFGDGKLVIGKGPVRTGVTVILPTEGNTWNEKLVAGSYTLNGNGEAMGLTWIQEGGILETPIALTNTMNVAKVQAGLIDWMTKQVPGIGVTDDTVCPVVLECDDSTLNDVRGQHVSSADVVKALDSAASGPVEEGTVGAGTGMISYELKGGIGTSSRVLTTEQGGYTVGVLLNANHGRRKQLRIMGHPLGETLALPSPYRPQEGSIVVIVATDAPLDSRQLSRLAKRTMLGISRTGSVAMHGSGDIAIAFSTANRVPHYPKAITYNMKIMSDFWMDPLFEATADASEEALLNALVAAQKVVGRDGNTALALPHEAVKGLFKRIN